MVEDEGGDAGFGVHHVAFGEVHADVRGLEGIEELLLAGEVGAGGVAETVTFAPVAAGKTVLRRSARGVWEAPLGPERAVQPLGGGLGGFDGEGCEHMAA